MAASRPTGQWLHTLLLMGLSDPGKEWTTCNIFFMPDSAIDLSTFDVKTCANDAYAFLDTGLSPLLGTDAKTIACHVQVSDGTTTIGATHYQSNVGTGGGPSLPEAEALVVATPCLAPGRHSVGHLRVSGISESLVQGNYLTSAGQAAADTWVGNISGTLSSSGVGFNPAVFHKPTLSLFAWISPSALGLVGSQRRRKPRL